MNPYAIAFGFLLGSLFGFWICYRSTRKETEKILIEAKEADAIIESQNRQIELLHLLNKYEKDLNDKLINSAIDRSINNNKEKEKEQHWNF